MAGYKTHTLIIGATTLTIGATTLSFLRLNIINLMFSTSRSGFTTLFTRLSFTLIITITVTLNVPIFAAVIALRTFIVLS